VNKQQDREKTISGRAMMEINQYWSRQNESSNTSW